MELVATAVASEAPEKEVAETGLVTRVGGRQVAEWALTGEGAQTADAVLVIQEAAVVAVKVAVKVAPKAALKVAPQATAATAALTAHEAAAATAALTLVQLPVKTVEVLAALLAAYMVATMALDLSFSLSLVAFQHAAAAIRRSPALVGPLRPTTRPQCPCRTGTSNEAGGANLLV